MTDTVLEVRNLRKEFRGVVALDDISFELRRHEVVGLIGENGAGKSTLLKVLSGIYKPDGGEILREGKKVTFRTAAESAAAGIGMVHQEQSLVTSISVAENIFLGVEGAGVAAGVYRWGTLRTLAQEQLDKIGSPISPKTKVEHLSFAERQMVELAKALSVEERADSEPVIVLDEPTSVLEGDELEVLFDQIDRLRKFASIVFVSHRLDEVLRVSDRVYVFKDGQCVAVRDRSEVDVDELHRLMVGRESTAEFYHEAKQTAVVDQPVLMQVTGLGKTKAFEDVNFTLRAGEVVGITGVLGSGREELSRVLFGAEGFDQGSITLGGKTIGLRSPVEAVRAGIGYIPAERRIEGIAQGLSVQENIFLADPSTVSAGPFLKPRAAAAAADEWIRKLKIKTPNRGTNISNLSGGNQQKAVLAKWLTSPRLKVLILDHPTRGLDVGAKEDVYGFIRELCARGIGVILLADTLEETIALSHTILVMRDGRVQQTFDAHPGNKPRPVDLVEGMV
ncbi:sugar ABC transporter ATP-binding protein [Mycetocola saprophilus]|uniref:sugar ABC transporter ATP-binding protein n=1 Tax=Mycetocola saprophilus TaxID=76636 RepID=UPI003BF398A2